MKKKLKFMLAVGCVAFACAGLTACSSETTLDQYEKQGYKIFVTYDANGGNFLKRPGVTIMDLFNPEKYEADQNDEIHIKLTDPLDKDRPTSASDKITLTKTDYSCVGWYQTRTIVTNSDGKPVDIYGEELTKLKDGSYVYAATAESEKPVVGTPAYTYSDLWDFETDTVDYSLDDGKFEMTLYAGWVPYFEFDYYVQNASGEWECYGTTTFDYKTTNAEGSKTADKDTIMLPQWSNGAMAYQSEYQNGDKYTFPKVAGTTFKKAYLDPECTQEITGSFEHTGTLDMATGTPSNFVQKIYVVVDQGEYYKIETAQQLVANANANGLYEIMADLDFTGVEWPKAFSSNVFNGSMSSSAGQTFAIKNVSVKFASNASGDTDGGLFAGLSKTAALKNLSFENVTFDLAQTAGRLRNAQFGLFAGYIDENATVEQIALDGAAFKIGAISLHGEYDVNVLANGKTAGITVKKPIKLSVYGVSLLDKFKYNVNPETVTVDSEGNITMEFPTNYQISEGVMEIGEYLG